MILRRWGARADPEGARQYQDHFHHAVLPELAGIDGHCGAYLLNRVDGTGVELTVMTLWTSMDAVRSFAGDNPQVAVVEDRAREVLVSFDDEVTHHEVVASTVGSA